jgi:hypothetical protein
MKTHLLNNILQLRLCKCKVLKSTNNRTIERSIRSRGPIRGRELGLRVDSRGCGFAIKHPSTIKELKSIPSLVKKEAIRKTHHLDPEEVVQRT